MPKPPPQEFKGQNERQNVQVFHHHHHEVVEPPPRRRSSIVSVYLYHLLYMLFTELLLNQLAKKNNKALYRRRMHAPAGVLEDGKGNAYYSKRTLNFNTSIARYKPGEAPAVTRKLNHIFGTIDPQRASPISERNMISSFSIVGGFDECEHLSEDENDYTHSIYDNDPFSRRRTSSLSLDNFDLVLQSLATLKEKEANWKPPSEDHLFSQEDSRSNFQLYNEKPQATHKKSKEIFLDDLKKVNENMESNIFDYSKNEKINNETFSAKEERKRDKPKKTNSKSPEAVVESDTDIGKNDMQRSVDSEPEDKEAKDFEPKKKTKKKTKKKKKESDDELDDEKMLDEKDEKKEIEIKKKDKKKKKKKKKEKVKDNEESDDVLNDEKMLDECDEPDIEAEYMSSKKKEKKKKEKKKKDKKKKDKKKKDKKEKERFSDDDDDDDGDVEKDSKDLEPSGNDNTAKVDRQSLQRRKEKIEALKQKADEEDAEAEAMENEADAEGDGGGGDEGGAAPEDEFAEEQFGIQYDPDRQICLGDKLKIGQKVFAVDMASGKKFRRGKIVGFEEPATYTVKFGMFRKQQTQRLDIQVRRPKMAKKGGVFGALKSPPSIHAAAAAGDIQGVLDNLVKNADSIDKVGGKLNQKPLYYACQNGHEEVAKLLLRWGGEDDPDGRILKVATPELRSTLLSFGWGKMGGFPDED